MAYERINWQNGEVGNTPLNANNLNRMDMTLEEHDQKIGDHDYEIENLKTGEQGITEEINKKMDRINPQGSGTLSIPAVNADNINAQVVEADEIKVTKVGSKGGTAPVAFDNDILVNGITTPIGSLASSASAKAESASERAEDAYNLASRANREAASAINLANDNKVKIDLHTGLIGEGVGDKLPILGYTDGYYIAPNGSVTQYNATATLIKIDFLDFLFRGDNIIFNHVDLLPTENCIPCAWYDISGNFISAADGLNIIAEIDEQTFKITKQYIDSCIIPVPAGASSCKLSGLANGRADIRIQTSLSEAIKDLQSKPEPATLVLTNSSPLPTTDGKKILGIDSLGKSWQETEVKFAFVSGLITPAIDTAINQQIQANSTRCTSDILQLPKGSVISAPSGYEIYLAHATTESGNIDISQVWVTTYTTAVDGYWRVVCRNKSNTSANITPSECRVIANVPPTPTNPIPIVDASTEVSAHTKNLLDDYAIGKAWNGDSNSARTCGYVPCKPNTTYTISYQDLNVDNIYVGEKASKEATTATVAISAIPSSKSKTITTNSESNYIVVQFNKTAITEVVCKSCLVMVELGSSATSYVPYQSNSVSLPFEPKSVGSVANELIINADRTGKIIRRVGVKVFNYVDGLNDANLETAYARVNLTDSALENYSTEYMTSHALPNSIRANNTAEGSYFYSNTMRFRKNDLRTKADWDNWIAQNPITVYYPLRVPVETTLTAEEVAAVLQLMTYKGTTTIKSEMDVVSVTYSGDVKAYVDGFHIYSTVPTICGYEADGQPRYRRVIKTTTPNSTNASLVFNGLKLADFTIKDIKGTIDYDENNVYPINFNMSTNNFSTIYQTLYGLYMKVGTNFVSKPCEIVVEYTLKDSAPAAASVMSLDETEE